MTQEDFRFPIDADESTLPFMSDINCDRFVYMFQRYNLLHGADIVIWKEQGEKFTRRVYASGPVIARLPDIKHLLEKLSDDESIPRSERIAQLLSKVGYPRKITVDAILDHETEIDQQEFQTIEGLARSLPASFYSVLGIDRAVRIIARSPVT